MAVDKDRYKALYEYQKAQFDDERTRYSKLEDKAAKYLTFLTIIISAYILLVSKFINTSNNIYCLTYAIIIFFVILTFFSFCGAWFSIFKSLRLQEVKKMPSDGELIEFFESNELPSVYLGLAENYSEAIEWYRIKNHDKTTLMQQGYKEIFHTAIFFIISILLIFLTQVA
ncbi:MULTISPECIES: hypothetical protein [Acinetobacter]|uniref:Uncharacterized protein n=4 Tax=Pseudomonadota TaxID=1224 RepID=A0A221SCA3_ACIBA|nr:MULTISPECIES: hypothetical protein [Acinetobacter calcoaceticus/baumannii complex]ASN73634.1 hypothetical protein [Acinetobacter baumannii]AYY91205.1 hypothetical protein EGM95_20755 [Acinetobacter baumannii]EKU9952608.1 hypothetical protein [Acinetobacter baumannii]EKX3723608.1 hypothetical protein [Acinetobacter baumannii]EKX3754436.1 hypothetical protein [Acinetobacter baumannii]